MFDKIDWNTRSDADHGFMVGLQLGESKAAASQINLCVFALSLGNVNAKLQAFMLLAADSALIQLASNDLANLRKPPMHSEMSPFINRIEPVVIAEYDRLRTIAKHTAFDESAEAIVNQSIKRLTSA